MVTLTQLLTVSTPVQNMSYLLGLLAAEGYANTTAWTTGTTPEGLLEVDAVSLTDVQQSRYNFAAGGLLDYAGTVIDKETGDTPYLTLHGDQVFNNQRFPAQSAVYLERFTDTLGIGYTIQPGGAGVSRGPGQPIYRTINTAPVAIPPGSYADIQVRAPVPGTEGNVPDGSLTYFAAGALPGVTVTNPGPGAVVNGLASEGVVPFVNRCRTKWELLSGGATTGAYVNMALFAGAGQVTKVRTRRNAVLDDPGRVDVYLANGSGPVAGGVVTTVQNFIDQPPADARRISTRIPETAKCVVHNTVAHTVAIVGTIAVWPEYNNTAFLTQIQDDLLAFQIDFPIGGLIQPPPSISPDGYVPRSRVIQLLLNRSGVALGPAQSVTLPTLSIGGSFTDDIILAFNEVLVFNVSGLQLVAVARTT